MKGLLRKDAEVIKSNFKSFIGIYVIALLVVLVSKSGASFFVTYIGMMSGILVVNTIAYDEMDNGMAFLMTLPVSRVTYVMEKYVFGLLFGIGGTLLAAVLGTGINAVRYPELNGSMEWMALIAVGGLIAWLAIVFMTPVQIKFGSESSRFIVFGMVFGIMIIGYGITYICRLLGMDLNALAEKIFSMPIPVLGMIALAVLAAGTAASAAVSVRIMKKKEF